MSVFVPKGVTVRRDVYTLYTCILWVQKKKRLRSRAGKNTHYYISAQAREGIKMGRCMMYDV